MKIALILAGALALLVLVGWLGLKLKPKPFPAYPAATPSLDTVPLPAGLPAPVEKFYRAVYGERVPIIETVVMTGRATIRPVFNIPLPARFIFIHNAGHDYRHYFEATFFGAPFLKVNEGYLDGKSFFESPMGSYTDDANTNQGANLALWAEAGWFPALLVTDPRVRWAPVDDRTALLYVPFEEGKESFVVRFNPETGLIDLMEAMRYREPGEGKSKILWITRNLAGPTIAGTVLPAIGSATWLDQGRPWATMILESIAYNADVGDYIRARGP
jgi:hypothetical protein